jgi:hypothetical protein
MSVTPEKTNVAVSDGPFGTVGGIQLTAGFQSSSVGFTLQVAPLA